MSPCLRPALLLMALASCGAARDQTMNQTLARFTLASGDIAEGQPIPRTFTCDGADQSPQLRWDDPPSGTKSLALIMDDPDAPSGTFGHWGAYDIPAATRGIERGQQVGKQATNGFGKRGYGGPCPPKGHGPHHYRYKLYALDVASLGLSEGADVPKVEAEAQRHQIGIAQLTALYERK